MSSSAFSVVAPPAAAPPASQQGKAPVNRLGSPIGAAPRIPPQPPASKRASKRKWAPSKVTPLERRRQRQVQRPPPLHPPPSLRALRPFLSGLRASPAIPIAPNPPLLCPRAEDPAGAIQMANRLPQGPIGHPKFVAKHIERHTCQKGTLAFRS